MEKTNESHEIQYNKEKGRIVLTSSTTKELGINEALNEIEQIRQQYQKVEQAITELNKNIKEKAWEKQLKKLEDDKTILQDVIQRYGIAIKEPSEKLESEMRTKMKEQKKKGKAKATQK